MPYITQERRIELDRGEDTPANAGELTYVLSVAVADYCENHKRRFQTFADVLAALSSTEGEFRRRILEPYEDEKIAENGDVFP